MKYIILSKKSGKLMTDSKFNSIEECESYKKNMIYFWRNKIKKSKLPKTRLNNWKSAVYKEVSFIDNFSVGGAYVEETHKNTPISRHKAFEYSLLRGVQNKVENKLKREYGKTGR